ncbi:DNA-binding transcriptional regulator, IclR family [Actinopolymorpha cephalotaxi]|uniref:DNA-binding IclR family transcriptional regulator n=1 Tax=Actinopolymorpha cephalotaxi TaxID=504797 RepID=A0A1I2KIF6_9ACTN|nr:IclR family transcriptional regulator [Actinopolymorpha cephalotaxi]NYH81204.1 DNA-binding IclR family transcriptional regulator [Actinopolymorpha cephalotaxi]SFF66010.1 DNA-binding transcriptional regulator, IclR family [Actinopolymorpha cephalotaxi]
MGRAVPAVLRALDVLELFGTTEELSIPEIHARLGLPRTTVHEIVGTLVERCYLAPVPGQPHRFRLGVGVFHLGSAYAERLDLAREGQAAAEEVAAACDETVHVAVLEGREVVYVAKVDSTHPVRMVSAVGRRLPAHCTAVGLMLLARLEQRALDTLFPPGRRLAGLTGRSLTTSRQLRERLDAVRADGLAQEYCESNEAVACVAAPVADHTGATVAAMSISVPTVRWSPERATELAGLARQGASALSGRLGHVPAVVAEVADRGETFR